MPEPVSLHYANGGQPLVVTCASCGTDLTGIQERAIAHTLGGIKFFCRADPDYPQDSCYSTYRRMHH